MICVKQTQSFDCLQIFYDAISGWKSSCRNAETDGHDGQEAFGHTGDDDPDEEENGIDPEVPDQEWDHEEDQGHGNTDPGNLKTDMKMKFIYNWHFFQIRDTSIYWLPWLFRHFTEKTKTYSKMNEFLEVSFMWKIVFIQIK